jgi:hypothetical protein
VLLAGAVAGAAAFPRFLAGPDSGQTPPFALLPGGTAPAIVRAAPLPVRPSAPLELVPVRIARVSITPAAQPVAKPTPKSRPVVVHHVAPPAPRPAPEPAPAPAPAVARTPAVVVEVAPATVPTPAPAPVASMAPPVTAAAPPPHDKGKGKDKGKSLGSDDHGPPAQAPPGTDNGDSGGVQPVEATDTQAAPSDHGHGPPPWSHGGGKGH